MPCVAKFPLTLCNLQVTTATAHAEFKNIAMQKHVLLRSLHNYAFSTLLTANEPN